MATMIFFMIISTICVMFIITYVGVSITNKLESIRICIIDVESELQILNKVIKKNSQVIVDD